MSRSSLDQTDRDFLQQLYDNTDGDTSTQVSMYEVGASLNLDRDASSQAAQTLIGLDLAEIKTLSGGIGISAEGVAWIEGDGTDHETATGTGARLSGDPVLGPAELESVEHLSGYLKKEAGGLGLDFDRLTELVADLRTIDAQLTSSRPKTDIVRGCFKSIETLMAELGHKGACDRLHTLIGE
jgi:hypothetical protein